MEMEDVCLSMNGDRSANLVAVDTLPGGSLVGALFNLILRGKIKPLCSLIHCLPLEAYFPLEINQGRK